jgi:hypothetical protein
MGIESEEGLLKNDVVVPERSSGSVSGTERAKICGVQSEKEAMRAAGKNVGRDLCADLSWAGLRRKRLRAERSHEVSRNVGDAQAGVSGTAIRII